MLWQKCCEDYKMSMEKYTTGLALYDLAKELLDKDDKMDIETIRKGAQQKDITYLLQEQFKSWMKSPQLPDWYKLNKYAELEHKFYNKNITKYPSDYIGIRFFQTFDRYVKMHFGYNLETSEPKKQIDILY